MGSPSRLVAGGWAPGGASPGWVGVTATYTLQGSRRGLCAETATPVVGQLQRSVLSPSVGQHAVDLILDTVLGAEEPSQPPLATSLALRRWSGLCFQEGRARVPPWGGARAILVLKENVLFAFF